MQDEHDKIQALIESRSAPDVINARLQEIHQQLEAITVDSFEIAQKLRAADDKRWTTIVRKKITFSQQVKSLICIQQVKGLICMHASI